MNDNDLEKMLVKLKKIHKEKNEQLQKRNNRKLRIAEKKRPVDKKKDANSGIAKIGE